MLEVRSECCISRYIDVPMFSRFSLFLTEEEQEEAGLREERELEREEALENDLRRERERERDSERD